MNGASASAHTHRVVEQVGVSREVIDVKLGLMRRQLQGMLEGGHLQEQSAIALEQALSQYVMSATRVVTTLRQIEGVLAAGAATNSPSDSEPACTASTQILR